MSEPSERDYFYEKSVLFTWLLDLMPPSLVRTRALRAFVEFLRRTETDVNRRSSGLPSSTGCWRWRMDRTARRCCQRWRTRTSRTVALRAARAADAGPQALS